MKLRITIEQHKDGSYEATLKGIPWALSAAVPAENMEKLMEKLKVLLKDWPKR